MADPREPKILLPAALAADILRHFFKVLIYFPDINDNFLKEEGSMIQTGRVTLYPLSIISLVPKHITDQCTGSCCFLKQTSQVRVGYLS